MMVSYDVKRVSKGTESFMVSFDFTKTPITQIADYIIIAASKHKASDIHFDPREEGMMVRFRIDGDCQDYTYVPKAYERNLTTRLKLLANMNITETRLPQDGAIKGEFGGTYLDMRVSVLPVNEGEKIVIRILDYSRSLSGIETLGFHPNNLEKIKRMMEIPNGIILTTGATGSGKSTTNYSILQGLNKPETNIITVEDPIEMNIEGINQVQVNAEIGMTFAAALRSILRQDPNVILIGEIRDSETAQIAVRASITGHLVLSTIHTNNSLATIERLLDMDVERYLLSTALTGIISQRLAKMLCPDCRIQRETTKYEKKVFKKYLHQDVPVIWDANPKGCENCRNGYHGRIALHEVLELDDDIRSALNNEKLEKKELAKMVYTGKTITMLQDALIKALEGKTSFEEVYRAIEIENEDDENYEQELSVIMPKIEKKEEIFVENSDSLLDDEGSKKESSISKKSSVIPTVQIPGTVKTNQESSHAQQQKMTPVQQHPVQQTVKQKAPAPQTIIKPQQNNQLAEQSRQPLKQGSTPGQSLQTPAVKSPAPIPTVQSMQQKPSIPTQNVQAPSNTVNKQQTVTLPIPKITMPTQPPQAVNAKTSTSPLPPITPQVNASNKVMPTVMNSASPIPSIVIPTQAPNQVNVKPINQTQVKPSTQVIVQQQPQVKQPIQQVNTPQVRQPQQVQVPLESQQQFSQILQRPPLEVKK